MKTKKMTKKSNQFSLKLFALQDASKPENLPVLPKNTDTALVIDTITDPGLVGPLVSTIETDLAVTDSPTASMGMRALETDNTLVRNLYSSKHHIPIEHNKPSLYQKGKNHPR